MSPIVASLGGEGHWAFPAGLPIMPEQVEKNRGGYKYTHN
jgi:hypothetical protein